MEEILGPGRIVKIHLGLVCFDACNCPTPSPDALTTHNMQKYSNNILQVLSLDLDLVLSLKALNLPDV